LLYARGHGQTGLYQGIRGVLGPKQGPRLFGINRCNLVQVSKSRQSPRYLATVPLRVRLVDSPRHSERIAESVNISTGGMLFASSIPFQIGILIDLVLEIPRRIAAESLREWHCKGKVIHVWPYSLPFGNSTVGIQFESYVPMTMANLLPQLDSDLTDGNDEAWP